MTNIEIALLALFIFTFVAFMVALGIVSWWTESVADTRAASRDMEPIRRQQPAH